MSKLTTVGHIPRGRLLRADIDCSRLGFGGSRLHYISTARGRQQILEAAYACGINYFDVAPVYGHGLAERALGSFLKRHAAERERFVVATKWGLPMASWLDRIPERAVGGAVMLEILRRKILGAPARPVLTSTLVIESLKASLRRLETPYIDILWLHEPERIPDPVAVLAALRQLRTDGMLRFVGIAGYPDHVRRTLKVFAQAQDPDLPLLLQSDEQGWTKENIPDVTFGAISLGPQRRCAPRIEGDQAGERLRVALARRAQGVVLISTTQPDNLRQLVQHVGVV